MNLRPHRYGDSYEVNAEGRPKKKKSMMCRERCMCSHKIKLKNMTESEKVHGQNAVNRDGFTKTKMLILLKVIFLCHYKSTEVY